LVTVNVAGDNAPMAEAPGTVAIPIRGGRIEAFRLPVAASARGMPLLVLGGVETGLRQLSGTEQVLLRRWEGRAKARPVVVVGRPLSDDPSQVEHLMHPRVIADAVATAIGWLVANDGPQPPFAIEAESGGGRISLWLTADHPECVSRLVLASVASETPADSPMAERMGRWIQMAVDDDWSSFFGNMAAVMRPASGGVAVSFEAAARLQPRPATPERFIGELRATLDASSFVTDRLHEIEVPTLVLVGGQDQVVPAESSQLVAERIPDSRLVTDPDCGHTLRTSMDGYDETVEAFLAEGDPR
jgi:pimeloyl-ACP methyl ester carboxylesterase